MFNNTIILLAILDISIEDYYKGNRYRHIIFKKAISFRHQLFLEKLFRAYLDGLDFSRSGIDCSIGNIGFEFYE